MADTSYRYNSSFVSQTSTTDRVVEREHFVISITMENIGAYRLDSLWRSAAGVMYAYDNSHYLGAVDDLTKSFGVIYGHIAKGDTVKAYGVGSHEYTFNLELIAPNNPGVHTLRYQMYVVLNENLPSDSPPEFYHYPFGPIVTVEITIQDAPTAELISIEYPESLEIAKRGTALITLKNTGIWDWDSSFRIESNNSDSLLFSKSRFYVPLGTIVNVGDEYTFRIPVRAPAISGTYNPCMRMWWSRCGNFGDVCCDSVVVTIPDSNIQSLDNYNWVNVTARRTTADISWQYTVTLNGSERPPDFGRLNHEIGGICVLNGELTEYDIDFDYPSISTILTAYSFGYFLNNRVPVKIPGTEIYLRQSRGGSDIKTWQKSESGIQYIQSRTEEMSTYENPSHYIKRILFYVDDITGKIDTTRPGPYGLWATDTMCSDSEKEITGGIPTIRPVPNWGIHQDQSGFDIYHPTTEDPFMIGKRQFTFDGDKIIDVLDEISDYCHMLYYTRFIKVDGEWREYFYWIPKYGVSLGWLGVDQGVEEITPTSLGLIGSPGLSATIVLEQSYNAVWVEACRKKDSAWFYSYKPGAGVIAGTESPRVLIYRSHDLLPDPSANNWISNINTSSNFGPGGISYGNASENANCQAIVEEKAQSLIDLLEYQIPTFTVTFQDRFFELYQVLNFNGFAGLTAFNGFDMQIIDIEYQFNPPSEGGHTVTLTVAPKAELQASGKFQSVVDEIQENFEKLKENISSGNTEDKVAVVISTYSDGTLCNAQLRSTGAMVKTRTYGYRSASG